MPRCLTGSAVPDYYLFHSLWASLGSLHLKKLKYMLIQSCTFLYVDSKTISIDIDVVYSKIPNKQKRENLVRHVFGSRNIQNVFM